MTTTPTTGSGLPPTPPEGSVVNITIGITGATNKKLGISFGERANKDDSGSSNKAIIISDIDKNSLAHETELHKGMELLSLNGVKDIQSSAAANQILSDAQGRITIVAKHPLGFIPICIRRQEDNTNGPLGISLGGATEQRGKKIVVLTDLQEGSPAALTQKLQPGMIIRAVNHKKCADLRPKDVYTLMYQQAGTIKLLVEPSNAYSRRAETEIFDTYHKPPPQGLDDDDGTVGFWVKVKHCGCKDVALLPCIFVMASFGLLFTNRKFSTRSIYIVNGQGYDKNGRVLGDESLFVK